MSAHPSNSHEKLQKLTLGIDPGTQYTGYGIVGCQGSRFFRVTSGAWSLHRYKQPEEKLYMLQKEIQQLLSTYSCEAAALEEAFYGKNAQSMLKLGRLQGVVFATLWAHQLKHIDSFTPTALKRAIVGHGHAEKEAVSHRVGLLLGESEYMQSARLDESDALAVALCCLLCNT